MLYLGFLFIAGAFSALVTGALNFICWLAIFFVLAIIDSWMWPAQSWGLSTIWGFLGIAWVLIRFFRAITGR